MNFNVEEFNSIIENINSRSNAAESALEKISQQIEELKTCIGNQESPQLYQGWDELKTQLDKVKNKYKTRKEEFLSELNKYKEATLNNNDTIYQSITAANQYLDSISSLIDSL